MDKKKYYLGLDIGTDSVGYAACDKEYKLLKFHGEPVWGSVIFDRASLKDERRRYRSARRRLDRRQARILFLQELFAEEIVKIDERFFVRLSESRLWRDDTPDKYIFFNNPDYTDKDYFGQYPTIHHLVVDLMKDETPHDIRLVYLACAWLIAHRGHFLSNVDENNIDEIKDIKSVYGRFINFFDSNGYVRPWADIDVERFGDILKKKTGVNAKFKELIEVLLNGVKPSKEASEEFPYSQEALIKLLAGGQCKAKDVFLKEEYEDIPSISLGMDEEKHAELMSLIGDDYDLIANLRLLYDWSVLADSLGNSDCISAAKVLVYEQHKKDLSSLKRLIRKYDKGNYNGVFREIKADNYVAYSMHSDESDVSKLKIAKKDDFYKCIKKVLGGFSQNLDEEDKDEYNDILARIDNGSFMPKQKSTDNRVIPYQLYLYELKAIVKKASKYLEFLNDKDTDGVLTSDKVISIFKYKLPYFVGPLNSDSDFAWISRKSGRITPWNYREMIDIDGSEQNFIKRMTNQCTYLLGEYVVPKDSLCYHKFTVLNEINNLKINGQKISVELKQEIYNQLFLKKRRVTRRNIVDYLISNGHIEKGEEESLSGIDNEIKSNLVPQIAFRKFIEEKKLSEKDVEKIIERASYAEDKKRLSVWLKKNYKELSDQDRKEICSVRIKDFGRLSRKFLMELEAPDKETGEAITILGTMWNTNDNLMEILSDRYEFRHKIEEFNRDYYSEHTSNLNDRLDDMYISNAVKRPIYRTIAILNDVCKAFGEPEKIFIEMMRGGTEDQKGQRTKSRYQQLLEMYSKCKDEDVRDLKHSLEAMGEYVDSKLRAERIFLYFMQFGKSAYSGKTIELEKLMAGSKEYDVDHIYPQAYVKDDSILNNKVLVLSSENGEKSDTYPIKADIRNKMHSTWAYWHHIGVITDEKYRRLTRTTGFTEDEKYGFINRQLTETSQSTKGVAQILKEKYPNTEIVYSKARLVSEFRQEFEIYKSRSFNDLHHAVDAYLNIVTGNVYNARFSKRYFKIDSAYSIKTKTLFTHQVMLGNEIVWKPDVMLERVKKTARKNNAHFVKYSFFKTGGLFDQNPVKKAAGLVPLKKGLDTEKYGGYNGAGIMFYTPVIYRVGKKKEMFIMSVELLYGDRFLMDVTFAKEYALNRMQKILGKKVDLVEFPMGLRAWKVNTVLSFDGFRGCITGTANGGMKLLIQSIVQFSDDDYWKFYVKKLEKYTEKISKNSKYIYDEEYDKVTESDNICLYNLYIDKLKNTLYNRRINNPVETLEKGKEKFLSLGLNEQAKCLINIHRVFGRMSGGCDLTYVGGVKNAAATTISTSVSNWKKKYDDVRIVDQSPSGMWEKVSENLLEYL